MKQTLINQIEELIDNLHRNKKRQYGIPYYLWR